MRKNAMCPPKKCAVSRNKSNRTHEKSGACQKKKSNPPTNLELVKKTSRTHQKIWSLSKKQIELMTKMELFKKQVEAAKNCLHITKKFESAKTIAGACYKKKQRFAKHICHYFKSCTMVQPVMLAYIYIYDRHFHCHLHYILYCIFIYTIIFVAVVAQALSFCPAVAAVFDRFNRWRIMAPAGTARKLHRLEQTSNGSSS